MSTFTQEQEARIREIVQAVLAERDAKLAEQLEQDTAELVLVQGKTTPN